MSNRLRRLTAAPLLEHSPSVRMPGYARERVRSGIVHIGVGAFNRSHLAGYLDELLEQGRDRRWGEYGVGLLPPDRILHLTLAEQDFLYGVWVRNDTEETYRVIGSLTGHAYAPEQTEEVVVRMSSPECSIVSMTVTEGGYFENAATGEFTESDPDVAHDLHHPDQPRTWMGYVARSAELRFRNGAGAFTLLSCDNLPHNGDTARRSLLAFVRRRDARLADWMCNNVSFPNSMVDRITPRTTGEHIAAIEAKYGLHDAAAVVCEPFRQWVLEDKFITGRPEFEAVGVQFTTQVAAYEEMKLRLLNGAHFTLAYSSALMGIELVADAMRDDLVARLIEAYQREAATTLRDLTGMGVSEYSAKVRERFGNTTIRDQVQRICSEGTAKLKRFLAPQLETILGNGLPFEVSAFVIASWLRYLDGFDDEGQTIVVEDKLLPPTGRHDLSSLRNGSLLGPIASTSAAFLERVKYWLVRLRAEGTRRVLISLTELRVSQS